MENSARNIDRLVTVGARWGSRRDRWIIVPLYESACQKLDGRPISLVAAEELIAAVGTGDRVLLLSDFASHPNMPSGETDGPLGVASLARGVRFGLGALPVLVAGPGSVEATRYTAKAAGFNILDYEVAEKTSSAAAVEVPFPILDRGESERLARSILDEYSPKAVVSVETVGPNVKGVKHFAAGKNLEAEAKAPSLEHLFYEASARKILTIGVIDQGNELGSGTIEEDVRKVTPYGDVCQCPCEAGIACSVKSDIVFPANISNWGAYAVSAMLGLLLGKVEILQDVDTEHRMLEACAMAGACDGPTGRAIMAVDGVGYQCNEGIVSILHCIVANALSGMTVEERFRK